MRTYQLATLSLLAAMAAEAKAQNTVSSYSSSSAPAAAAPAAGESLPLTSSHTQGLSLEQAMDMAETHSYQLKIAGSTADEAEARAGQTTANLGPKVSINAEDAWLDKHVNQGVGQTFITGYLIPPRVENASISAVQPISGLGPIIAKIRADSLTAEAARHDQSETQAMARLYGADAYIRALKAQRIYEIAEASLGAVKKQRDDASALESNGKLSRVDVVRLNFAMSDAQTQLIQARSALDIAALSLIETLGLPRTNQTITLQAANGSSFEERKLAAPPLAAELGHANDAREDLISADKRIQAAEKYKTAAAWDYIPTINGFAKLSRDWEVLGVDIPAPLSTPPINYSSNQLRDSFVVGATLDWVIWDWGSRSRRQGELAATVEKARQAHDSLASQVHLQVASAHSELSYAEQAVNSAHEALLLAEEVYRATNLKFKNGLATTTDLIEAERDQTRARATLANTQGDLDLAWLKLKKAAGERVAW